MKALPTLGNCMLPLDLIAVSAEHLHAENRSLRALSFALKVHVPLGWPPAIWKEEANRNQLLRLLEDPTREQNPLANYIVWRSGRANWGCLIGIVGFLDVPDADGQVELQFLVLPEFREVGYSTEAVAPLLEQAFRDPAVQRITASSQTMDKLAIRTLKKLGFSPEEASQGKVSSLLVLTRAAHHLAIQSGFYLPAFPQAVADLKCRQA